MPTSELLTPETNTLKYPPRHIQPATRNRQRRTWALTKLILRCYGSPQYDSMKMVSGYWQQGWRIEAEDVAKIS
jgi:hypothetical protein